MRDFVEKLNPILFFNDFGEITSGRRWLDRWAVGMVALPEITSGSNISNINSSNSSRNSSRNSSNSCYYFLLEPNDQCHLILTIITHLEAYAPGRRCGGLFPQFKHYLNMQIKSGMGMRSPEPFHNCMKIYIHWLCSRLLARVVRCSASGSVLYSSPATA